MTRTIATSLFAALTIVSTAAPAHAADCRINNPRPLAFGRYEPQALQGLTEQGELKLVCTKTRPGDSAMIWLGPGLHATGWSRRMASGTSRLGYQVYLDASRTRLWGDGSGGTSVWQEVLLGNGMDRVEYFGHVPAGQYVAPGSYSDTLVVTVVF